MGFTTKELAELCEVTPQSVRNYISKNERSEETKELCGKLVIEDSLAKDICEHFGKSLESVGESDKKETENQEETPKDSEVKTDYVSSDAAVNALVKQLEILQKQLEIKDKQIETLTDALANANESVKALAASNAMQTAAEKKEILLAESVEDPQQSPKEEKKSWWQKIFG